MTAENNASSKTVRNSSIELLRIIAMLAIVFCHFATHGGFNYGAHDLSLPRFWWNFIEMGGNFGVDVFVLISGYFLVNDNKSFFSFKRILKFWGQVFFYSFVLYCAFLFSGRIPLDLTVFIKTVFPITFGSWWFASTYFVLYLIHPFLNILLNRLDKSAFQKLLTLLIIMWCIIPTFLTKWYESNNLLWFVTLYCTAGYIKLYGLNSKIKTKHYLILWIVFSFLRYLSCVMLMLMGTQLSIAYEHTLFFYSINSVLTFLSALNLFMVFKNIDIGHRKWINIIASAAFGVYLIHDSPFVRYLLWGDIFKNAAYQDSNMLILYSIGVGLLVYAVCTVIDLIRQQIFEKPYMKLVNNYSDTLFHSVRSIYIFVKNIIFGS
ncbi:MAG: acyltransferase [Clostridiales bacterium]|nr:acyltransferase [Clostridiales bacterium]